MDFYLDIENKTAQSQNVVLFDVVGAQNGSNALAQSVKYQWDITGSLITAAIFSQSKLAVLAALNPTGSYQLYTYTNPGGTWSTAAEVVTGLNSLGIGSFTNVGNIITAYNSNYLISSLNLCNLSNAIADSSNVYDINGSLIYAAGFTSGLVGGLSRINTGNAFWINNPANLVNGPYNRVGITSSTADNGSFFCEITSAVQKTVYIGVSSQRGLLVSYPPASLYVNNALIWQVLTAGDAAAVAANVNAVLGTGFAANEIMESLFHIVPVTLVAGKNIIQGDFRLGMGLEIYDNTAAQIAAATSYAGLNVLYKSSSYIGQQLF